MAAYSARELAEAQLARLTSQQDTQTKHLQEAHQIAASTWQSKAEGAELQLRRLREEIASLKSAHSAELAASAERHQAEIDGLRRATAAEREGASARSCTAPNWRSWPSRCRGRWAR